MVEAGNSKAMNGAGAPTPAESAFFSDEARPIDPDVAARVLRKIDVFLMPAMVIGMWHAGFFFSMIGL